MIKLYQNRLIQANRGIFPVRHFATCSDCGNSIDPPGTARISKRVNDTDMVRFMPFEAPDTVLVFVILQK